MSDEKLLSTDDVLRRVLRLIDEALPKFDWGTSALDANAIRLLNEVPREVRAILADRARVAGEASPPPVAQEPVAWLLFCDAGFYRGTVFDYAKRPQAYAAWNVTPVYAAPAVAQEPARVIGRIRIRSNGHPFAQLDTGYDEHGNGWKEGTPIYAAPAVAQEARDETRNVRNKP